MKPIFHPESTWELWDATDYYLSCGEPLGLRFYHAAEEAVNEIAKSPFARPIFWGSYRIRMVRGFPYGILYGIGSTDFHVYAVANLRRPMRYWKKRLKRRRRGF